jgi:hypothetical protein
MHEDRITDLRAIFPSKHFPKVVMRELDAVLVSALMTRLQRPIPGGCDSSQSPLTYLDVLNAGEEGPGCLLIKGGIVRDLVYEGPSAKMRDVDVCYHGMDVYELRDRILSNTKRCRHVAVSPGLGYIVIGTDPDDRLEAMKLKPGECYSDGRCNSLFIDVVSRLLIDPTGGGVQDARDRVWQIPCGDPQLWLQLTRIALWRMLKFQTMRPPFTVPDSTAAIVYNSWYHERDAISDAQWRNVTFRHIDPKRIAEVVEFMAEQVDRLKGVGALSFTGADMVQVLLRKGVLVAYQPPAVMAAPTKKHKNRKHKKR